MLLGNLGVSLTASHNIHLEGFNACAISVKAVESSMVAGIL